MIMYPNVFIEDIGSSVDGTGHIHGFRKKMKPEKWYSTTPPKGTKTATEIIADLRRIVCDNQGNKSTKVMLSKVRYSLKNKFNLFSVTKRLISGWDIGGDGNKIWLRKNGQTIKFDININTKGVIIFAIYINQEFSTQEISAMGADYRMKVSINKAHELLGQMNEDVTRAAEK